MEEVKQQPLQGMESRERDGYKSLSIKLPMLTRLPAMTPTIRAIRSCISPLTYTL
mgnify:CR=1 FL=1